MRDNFSLFENMRRMVNAWDHSEHGLRYSWINRKGELILEKRCSMCQQTRLFSFYAFVVVKLISNDLLYPIVLNKIPNVELLNWIVTLGRKLRWLCNWWSFAKLLSRIIDLSFENMECMGTTEVKTTSSWKYYWIRGFNSQRCSTKVTEC